MIARSFLYLFERLTISMCFPFKQNKRLIYHFCVCCVRCMWDAYRLSILFCSCVSLFVYCACSDNVFVFCIVCRFKSLTLCSIHLYDWFRCFITSIYILGGEFCFKYDMSYALYALYTWFAVDVCIT